MPTQPERTDDKKLIPLDDPSVRGVLVAAETQGNAQHHIEGAKIPEGGSGSSTAGSDGGDGKLPSMLSLKGSCPNITDGLDSVDFVRSLRDGPQIECPKCGHSIREEGDRDWIDVYRQKFRAAETERAWVHAQRPAGTRCHFVAQKKMRRWKNSGRCSHPRREGKMPWYDSRNASQHGGRLTWTER